MPDEKPSENDLLTADSVHLLKTHGQDKPDTWHLCRVIKRNGRLIAITTQGQSEYETPILDNANFDWSSDKTIVVTFNDENKL